MMDKNTEALSIKFQEDLETMKQLQKQYQKLVQVNQQLDTQLNENMMVKEEFDLIKEDAKVFKQVGDILIPQTYAEAKMNVENRISYIKAEMKRNNEEIDKKEKNLATRREQIQNMEKQLVALIQQNQAKQGQVVGK